MKTNTSNIVAVSLASAALLSLAPSSAFAGEIFNDITTRHTQGSTTVRVNGSSYVNGVKRTTESLYKLDAVGERAGASISFDGYKVKGSAFATNVENPDPFVVFGQATTKTREVYGSDENVRVVDKSTYNEASTRYTLGTSY